MMRKLRPTRGRNLDGYCTKTGTLRCERASNFHGGRRQPARHEAGGGRLDGDPDDWPLHLCLDKGYDDPAVHELVADWGYTAHIARRGTERPKTQVPGYRARCWVVGGPTRGSTASGTCGAVGRRSRPTTWPCCTRPAPG